MEDLSLMDSKNINALTLIVSPTDFREVAEGEMPTLTGLRGTFQDAGLVDRVLFVADDGTQMYLKDRYPAEHMPGITVLNHYIVRPNNIPIDQREGWLDEVNAYRAHLCTHGTLK